MDNIFDNDADIDAFNLEQAGNRVAALKKRGVCVHGWSQHLPDGRVQCKECGKMFADAEAHDEEYRDLID